MPDIFPDWFIR